MTSLKKQNDSAILINFLQRLEKALANIAPSIRTDIVREFESVIEDKMSELPEKDLQDILNDIDSPEEIAARYQAECSEFYQNPKEDAKFTEKILRSAFNSKTTSYVDSLPINNIHAVSIHVSEADVSITSNIETTIQIDAEFRISKDVPRENVLKTEIINGVLNIQDKGSKLSATVVNLRLQIPANIPLIIETKSGDIEICDRHAEILISTVSGDVEVTSSENNIKVKSISGDCKIDRVKGDTHIQNISGDISLSSFIGDVFLTSKSGDSSIQNGEGNIKTESMSGDISIENVTGNVIAKCASSNISMENTSGNIIAEVKNGDISLDLKSFHGISAGTLNGDINVKVPAKINATINIETRWGDVKIEGINYQQSSRHRKQNFVLGDGSLPIHLASSNGDISVIFH